MKIAVSAKGTDFSSPVAPIPGRDVGFVVYDPFRFNFTVLNDTNKGTSFPCLEDGWVETIVEAGVEVLVVGGIDHQAACRLRRSGITTYKCNSATVWEAIQALKLNLLPDLGATSDPLYAWNGLKD